MRVSTWMAGLSLCVALPAWAEDPPPAASAPPAPAASAPPAPAAPPKGNDLEAQLAVWNVISGSASQIDACTQRYTQENEGKAGEATISVKVGVDGRVVTASTQTALNAADRLIDCMTTAARFWRFPKGDFDLSVPVKVAPGVKLRLKKPGEKDPPPPAGQAPAPKQDEGFIRFLPSWESK